MSVFGRSGRTRVRLADAERRSLFARDFRATIARMSGATKTATICLNMIVKNESRVIERCLDSVRPFIHHWVIVDTGSTDGTQRIIREALRDLPGELHERPWKDFGHNRTEALDLGRGRADYTLIRPRRVAIFRCRRATVLRA